MQIFISGLTKDHLKSTLAYDCTPNTKVSELRNFIKTKYKYPNDVYILKCNGKILNNSWKTFDNCGISDLSTVHFIVTNTVNFNRMSSYSKYKAHKDGLKMDNNN